MRQSETRKVITWVFWSSRKNLATPSVHNRSISHIDEIESLWEFCTYLFLYYSLLSFTFASVRVSRMAVAEIECRSRDEWNEADDWIKPPPCCYPIMPCPFSHRRWLLNLEPLMTTRIAMPFIEIYEYQWILNFYNVVSQSLPAFASFTIELLNSW